MSLNFISKEDIVSGIKIVDLAREFNIELENVISNNFDYRCRCPSPNHKNGQERTPSCYINSKDNDFMCYGCSASLNSIDFYMLCAGVDFSTAMFELKKRLKVGTGKGIPNQVVENSFTLLLEISKILRAAMLNHPDDLAWINKLMIYTDNFILDIDSKDVKKAKYLLNKIQQKINERYEV